MNQKNILVFVTFVLVLFIIYACEDLRLAASMISIIGSFIIISRNIGLISEGLSDDHDKKSQNSNNDNKSPKSNNDSKETSVVHATDEVEERDTTLLPIYKEEIFRNDLYTDTYVGEAGPISDIVDPNILQEPMVEHMDNYNKPHLAQREAMQRESYNTPYTTLAPLRGLGSEAGQNNMDAANVQQVRARTRDQRCLTGAALKDANFYKPHYADEFVTSESKPWWGREDW